MKNIILIPVLFLFIIASGYCANPYKGGEYRTKEAFTYGRFEVNYKPAKGNGILSTFFTYFDGTSTDPWGADKWNEIDLEILGRYNDNVQFNTITPGQVNHVRSHYTSFDPTEDYHTYAIEWTPAFIAWFIDGVEVYRQMENHVRTVTHPQKIMMNIWQPAFPNWVGAFDPAILPIFAYYDWVSYYEYTPGAGNYGTGNNFTHSWTDNFDSWDQARWDKATHTFHGNNVDFIHENIVFENGKMILCLTDDDNIGFKDITKPTVQWARYSDNEAEVMFSEEVETATAETITNYIISGVTVNSVVQQKDKRKVVLSLTGYDNTVSKTLIVRNVADSAGNVMSARSLAVINAQSLSFPVKINIGGNAWGDYLPDQEWSEKVEYGYMEGTASSSSNAISNTEEDAVYQSERYGLVAYRVRVPSGSYNVKLMFAELYFTETGARVFDVVVEDSLHRSLKVDLYKLASKDKALEMNFTGVNVDDGILNIYLPAHVNNSTITGIVIEDAATGVEMDDILLPSKMTLEQNYPNPFNGSTIIKYSVSQKDDLTFTIYDVLGCVIYENKLGERSAGNYELKWNALASSGKPASSGVYIYRLRGSFADISKKLVLMN
jgi:hypothetical protein